MEPPLVCSSGRRAYMAIDIDQDTKILAEQTPDDDTLRFYTSGIQRLTINSVGNIDISGSMSGKRIKLVNETL